MIFSGQNMKSKAVSSCQQNIKIPFQDLFALCTKALWVQVPLTQISISSHLTYIHSHLCLCSIIMSVPGLSLHSVISTFCAKSTCYTVIENFHCAKHCMRRKVFSISIIILIFFNKEPENERALLKLILFFSKYGRVPLVKSGLLRQLDWWLNILVQIVMALFALSYVQWGVWTRSEVIRQGNTSHMFPNIRFC